MKYSSGKRSHLELVFFSQEATDNWADRNIAIVGKNFRGHKALSNNKTFLTVALSGVPLGSRKENTNQIKTTFDKFGKVVVIKPKLWEGTMICSDKWSVTFDTTDLLDVTSLTSSLPRTTNINGDKVYVTWKSAPSYCTFCKKNGHKRSECRDLQNANGLLPKKTTEPSPDALPVVDKGKGKADPPSDQEDESMPLADTTNNIHQGDQSLQDRPPTPHTHLNSDEVTKEDLPQMDTLPVENDPEGSFTLVENRKKKKQPKPSKETQQPTKSHNTRSKPLSSS
jgi:hypothetical protein